MGVKTPLNIEDITPFFPCTKLKKTKNGVSDTVYILNDTYVLKLFESASIKEVEQERALYTFTKDLPLPHIIDSFCIANKPALIYKKAKGKSIHKVKKSDIKKIGKFLRSLHQQTKGKKSSNKKLFTKKNLQKMIQKTAKIEFQNLFDSLKDLPLHNEGIIHGDLFCDNALFYKKKLSCVIDWTEACNGNFTFDLAVVASSWCFDDEKPNYEKINALLCSYGLDMPLAEFKKYIKYALLYYATTRYLHRRDFLELYNKIEKLNQPREQT